MRLSAEQLYEVMLALRFGLQNAAWEGEGDAPWDELSGQQQEHLLTRIRGFHERQLALIPAEPSADRLNQMFLGRMTLASVRAERAEEERMRAEAKVRAANKTRTSSRGLRMAVNDLLANSGFFSRGQRRAVERRLAARGLPTLERLEVMFDGRLARILKRGRIASPEEFYLATEVLAAVDFDIEDADRARLAEMHQAYVPKRPTP